MGSLGRRDFLKFLGRSAAGSLVAPSLLTSASMISGCSTGPGKSSGLIAGLPPDSIDQLSLIQGMQYKVIAKWGDPINKKGDTFGTHCDFTTFIPFKGKTDEGLLWVNHESLSPQYVHGKPISQLKRTKEEIEKEQYQVGGSIIHIKKDQNSWSMVKDSKYNRRISGQTRIPFSGNHKIMGSDKAHGTIANCAGGQTPWRTVLTSEENYHNFYGDIEFKEGKRHFVESDKFRWYSKMPFPPEHYGWVVEIDPFTGKAKKQVKLGRASHEGATVAVTKDNRAVVYMGEDRSGGFIFKFVSTGMHLDDGTLYAADTIRGKWLPLEYKSSPVLQKEFKDQLQVLTYSRRAAEILGATPQDRPEDIEVDPVTGNIVVSLTNNKKAGNYFGSLLKITEGNDFSGTSFKAASWISGGPDSGFACPDNLAFDNNGHLWFTVDVSEKAIGKGPYKEFGNNGLFYVPLKGPKAGIAVQVASAPKDAELTGPWFSPDYKSLFLSVQHPGISSRETPYAPNSNWPDGGQATPRSSVVALSGPLFDQLTGYDGVSVLAQKSN